MARSGGSRMQKPCDCCRRYLDHLDGKNHKMSCFLRRMNADSKHSMIVPKRFLRHFAWKLSGTIKIESPNGILYDVEVRQHLNKMFLRRGWEAFVDAHHIEENDFLLFRHVENSCFEVLILGSDGCEKVFSCAGIKRTPSVDDTRKSLESERSARVNTAKMAAPSSSSESEQNIPSENSVESDEDDRQSPPRADYVLSHRSYLSEEQKERVMAFIQETQPEIPVFVAIMQKSNVQSRSAYLVIPKAYALEHVPRKITRITLEMPGKNKKWHPRLYIRNGRSLYMLRGQWLDFVCDNHVKQGDICILVPTKDGRNFKLKVDLLRANANIHSRGGSRSGSQRDDPCHCRSSAKMTSAVHMREKSTNEHVSSESEKSSSCDKVNSTYHQQTAKMAALCSSYEESEENNPSEQDSVESDEDDRQTSPRAGYVLSRRVYLSEAQKKKVTAFIQETQPEIPVFVAIMQKSNIQQPCLVVAKEYAVAHLPRENTDVTLQMPGKSKKWHLRWSIREDRSSYKLGGQWLHFVRDNHVQLGDICVFLPTKAGREYKLMVYLLPKATTHSRGRCGSGFQKADPCHGRSSAKMTSVHMREESTDAEHGSSESDMNEISDESLNNTDSGDPSKPLYILPRKSCLSESQKRIIEPKVRAIQSELPIYVVIMRKSNVNDKQSMLGIGTQYATTVHLPARSQTVVLQCMRNIWKTKMVVYSGRRQFLAAGWLNFVRDNGLRLGDICLFELKKNERKLAMVVHIISREQLRL